MVKEFMHSFNTSEESTVFAFHISLKTFLLVQKGQVDPAELVSTVWSGKPEHFTGRK